MSPTTRITLRLLEAARELEEEQAVQQDRTEQQLRALEDKLLHSEHERSEMQLLAVWVRKERDQLRDENADLLRALEERDAELKRLRAGVSRDAAIAQAQGGADVRGLARELVQTRFALALLADSAAARLAASRNDGSATQQRASVPFGHDAHKENAPPVVEAAGGLRSKGNVPEQAAEADATAGGRAANPGAESGGSFDGAIELRADALTELRNALAPLSLAQLLGAAGSGDGVRLMQILAPILLLAPPASALPANGAGGAAGGAASRRRSIAPTPGAPAAGDWRSPSPFRSSENEPSSAGSNFASSAPGSASGSAGSSGTPQSAGGAAGVSEHGDPAPVPGAGRSGLFSPGPQGSAHFPSAAPTPAHSGGADGEQAGAQQEKPDSAGAEGSAPDMNPAARPLQLLPALDATLSSALLRLLLAHSAAPGPELPRSAAESVAALLALGATVNLPLAAGATATAPPQPLAPRSPAAAAMAAAGAGAPAAGAGGEADLAVAARAAKDAGSPPGVLHAGSSLLHALVAARGREAVLSAVLAAGASVDALDGSGRSALHVAAACGHAEGAEFLLRHGASLLLADDAGRTAEDIATATAAAATAAAAAAEPAAAAASSADAASASATSAWAASAAASLSVFRDGSLVFWSLVRSANSLYKRARYAQARAAYAEILKRAAAGGSLEGVQIEAANLGTIHYNWARAAFKDGLHLEALAQCELALEQQRGYPNALIQRAQCHMELLDFKAATAAYDDLCKMAAAHADSPPGGAPASEWIELRERARALRDADPCDILEIDQALLGPPADEGALRKAYRAQCLRWHPDKHTGSAEEGARANNMFRRLSDAFELLSDPARRADYLARAPHAAAAARREREREREAGAATGGRRAPPPPAAWQYGGSAPAHGGASPAGAASGGPGAGGGANAGFAGRTPPPPRSYAHTPRYGWQHGVGGSAGGSRGSDDESPPSAASGTGCGGGCGSSGVFDGAGDAGYAHASSRSAHEQQPFASPRAPRPSPAAWSTPPPASAPRRSAASGHHGTSSSAFSGGGGSDAHSRVPPSAEKVRRWASFSFQGGQA